MTLRRYVIIASVLLLLVTGWLFLAPENMGLATLVAAAILWAILFFYIVGRLFWAIVHRLER